MSERSETKSDDDFHFEILEKVGVISSNPSGWFKELNVVKWNVADPKYDIRDWHPNHGKMGRGITLTEDELRQLKDLLNQTDIGIKKPA